MGGVDTSMLCSLWLLVLVSGMVAGMVGAVTSPPQSRLSLPIAGTFHLAATGDWDAAADVNHDCRITSLDAPRILQTAAET